MSFALRDRIYRDYQNVIVLQYLHQNAWSLANIRNNETEWIMMFAIKISEKNSLIVYIILVREHGYKWGGKKRREKG